jgi:ShK domain-like
MGNQNDHAWDCSVFVVVLLLFLCCCHCHSDCGLVTICPLSSTILSELCLRERMNPFTLETRNLCGGLAMRRSRLFLLVVLSATCSLPLIQAGKNNDNKVRGECIPYQSDLSGYHCHRPTAKNSTSTSSSAPSTTTSSCIDENEQCAAWLKQGECTSNPHYMLLHCAKSCNSCVSAHAGVTQIAGSDLNARLVLDHVISTEHYLREEVMYKVQYLQTCLNRHELCTVWALQGHCNDGSEKQEYMEQKCAPACKTCHKAVN